MSLCVAGITALQLYFSYKNYTAATAAFKKESNEAFFEAVDSTFSIHRRNVADDLGMWLADTTHIHISSKWDPEKLTTVFTIRELATGGGESGEIVMSVEGLNEKGPITPEIKTAFIKQMQNMVKQQLKSGGIIYFTQELGKKINSAYVDTPIHVKLLERQYEQALKKRGMALPFTIEENERGGIFCTDNANLATQGERWVSACFEDTDMFLLARLKWVIAGSLLLILITLACFWYTAKTLLTQQKLNNLKDDFISNMTHEIHTPLTSVMVTAEALKKFSHDEEARRNYIEIILHQSKKLSTLTDEILTGAKLEKQGMALNDTIDIKNLLQEAAEGFTGVMLTVPNEEIYYKGNRIHFTNAITNLVDNAIKYNTSVKPVVTLDCTVSGREITITVSDNGPGIPDEHKRKIFGQFYRVPSGNVHDVKGYGLGLSYVQKVVHAHRGTITVEDNKPKGSTFKIKLPYAA